MSGDKSQGAWSRSVGTLNDNFNAMSVGPALAEVDPAKLAPKGAWGKGKPRAAPKAASSPEADKPKATTTNKTAAGAGAAHSGPKSARLTAKLHNPTREPHQPLEAPKKSDNHSQEHKESLSQKERRPEAPPGLTQANTNEPPMLNALLKGVLAPASSKKPVNHASGGNSFVYYQDRHKKWPFHCGDDGGALLRRVLLLASSIMDDTDRRIMEQVKAEIAAADGTGAAETIAAAVDRIENEGRDIYDQKRTLKKGAQATWSEFEYSHLGFQLEYVRYKSVQRFTEVWAALQRMQHHGFPFESETAPKASKAAYRVFGLGGGPGFELVAVREFMGMHYPQTKLALASLDLESSWGKIAVQLGVSFQAWDLNSEAARDSLRNTSLQLHPSTGADDTGCIDLAIMSYVLHSHAQDASLEWMGQALAQGIVRAFLVIEGGEYSTQHQMDVLERSGVDIVRLMPQGVQDPRTKEVIPRTDMRQLLLLHKPSDEASSTKHLITSASLSSLPEKEQATPVFPNVPYEEHKLQAAKRGHGHGYGHAHGHGSRHGKYDDNDQGQGKAQDVRRASRPSDAQAAEATGGAASSQSPWRRGGSQPSGPSGDAARGQAFGGRGWDHHKDRDKDRDRDAGRNRGSHGGFGGGAAADHSSASGRQAPRERPRLKLLPRSKPAEPK